MIGSFPKSATKRQLPRLFWDTSKPPGVEHNPELVGSNWALILSEGVKWRSTKLSKKLLTSKLSSLYGKNLFIDYLRTISSRYELGFDNPWEKPMRKTHDEVRGANCGKVFGKIRVFSGREKYLLSRITRTQVSWFMWTSTFKKLMCIRKLNLFIFRFFQNFGRRKMAIYLTIANSGLRFSEIRIDRIASGLA